MTTPQTQELDVIELLLKQHSYIRELFAKVDMTAPEGRSRAFDELRRFLAVHETAEEMVVHPATERSKGGKAVAQARLDEEHDAKEVLSDLDDMQVDDPTFAERFAALRRMVTAHAQNEEAEEFPLLRAHCDPDELRRMAGAVKAAESIAPTHPHAGVESPLANVAVGPLASVVDRTRDAIRAALDRP